ncbi:MAG: murein L,D-transpeptidase catalytic domain-containing protein [Ferruginibacter sp.]
MKITSLLFLGIATVTAVGYFFWYKPKDNKANKNYSFHVKINVADKALDTRLKQKAEGLLDYLEEENFNTEVCFLIDMNINSGKKRFFVYNLEKDSLEMAGLVTHGSGSFKSDSSLYFSNESGSNCTSLGKYKIGKSYNGKFGLAYKLYGLDKTNDNAFERFVVLHAHSCVPEAEVYPESICESWGCPTVSPIFLQSLKKMIDASEKPILLKIFY